MNKRSSKTTYRNLAEFVATFRRKGDAAKQLKIVPSYLTMLLAGQRSPSLEVMDRCASLGIPMDSWRRPEGKGAAA